MRNRLGAHWRTTFVKTRRPQTAIASRPCHARHVRPPSLKSWRITRPAFSSLATTMAATSTRSSTSTRPPAAPAPGRARSRRGCADPGRQSCHLRPLCPPGAVRSPELSAILDRGRSLFWRGQYDEALAPLQRAKQPYRARYQSTAAPTWIASPRPSTGNWATLPGREGTGRPPATSSAKPCACNPMTRPRRLAMPPPWPNWATRQRQCHLTGGVAHEFHLLAIALRPGRGSPPSKACPTPLSPPTKQHPLAQRQRCPLR